MNVLITSTTFIPSVLLCGHTQLEYLQKQGKLNYKFVISHFTNAENINWADIIVFLRSDSDIDAYVSKIAKRIGKKLVYVLDDDILNVPNYLSSAPYYLLKSTQKNIKTIMSNCDTFLTPSPVLLEKYGKNFKYKFLISEPSLNRIDTKLENKKVKIGFAGSIDRTQDINEILEEAIRKIVDKYGNSIEIEFMGAKPNFVEELNLKYIPYQDGYDAYTAYMSKCNWDIGLAPMPKTEFHRCKYFNKFVEYASFGIAGIYSNCEPYTYGVENNINGLLVDNDTNSWFNAICELIDNTKLRKEISKECLRQANEIYSLDAVANDYLTKITKDYKQIETEKVSSLSFVKFIIFFKRVFRKIKEQGLSFPSWFINKANKKIADINKKKLNGKNKEKLIDIIKSRKTMFIIAPMFDNSEGEYNKRVKHIDECFKDYYKVYYSGEDRLDEYLEVDLIDDNHASVICNSFDVNQARESMNLISLSKNCLIHGVTRFMRDRVSDDLYKLLDMKDVKVYWDTHGMIPEMYREAANYHTEQITSDIEKIFYEKVDVVICEDKKTTKHFIDKYGKRDIEYIEL